MRFALYSFIFILCAACVPEKGPLRYSLDGRIDDITPVQEPVSFQRLSSEILTPRCAECHRSIVNEARVLRWVVPGNPEESLLFQVVKSGEMPEDSAPLTSKELEVVRAYITGLLQSSP